MGQQKLSGDFSLLFFFLKNGQITTNLVEFSTIYGLYFTYTSGKEPKKGFETDKPVTINQIFSPPTKQVGDSATLSVGVTGDT